MSGLVIRGGTVVNAGGRCEADVRIEGGRMVAVGVDVKQPGDQVLDAAGCYVMPGGIDPHTHIEMPVGDGEFNADDWFSGTAAALAGGTTCVIDMITPEGSLGAALQDWRTRAARKAVCDYSFHMGVIDAATIPQMAGVVVQGVPSFKIYLAYKHRLMVDDAAAFRIMREAGRLGAWTLVHAENGDLIDLLTAEARAAGRLGAGVHGETRPPAGEGEAAHRAIQLARLAEAPVYIVHVSCAEALAAVADARRRGWRVAGEACVHHLLLTDEEYRRPGFEAAPYVLSPPLRDRTHVDALWRGLTAGDLDTTATDHCPWHLHGQKDRGEHDFSLIPNGAGSVEERLALLWTHGVAAGRWTPEQFVARTSANAARIFGLTSKGAVAPGYDADVVVWDPAIRRTLSARTQRSRCDHSIWEGMAVTGGPRYVLVRGNPAPPPGWGRFQQREPRRT